MANFLSSISKLLFKTGVLATFFVQICCAEDAPAAMPLAAGNNLSFSEAVNTLKKAEKERRAPGFRLQEKAASSTTQTPSLIETVASQSNNREIKRQQSELDVIKQENMRLEKEILSLMGENTQDEDHWTDYGLPDISPSFPGFARLMSKNGSLNTTLTFGYSSWMFDNNRKIVDLAAKVMGYDPVQLQDILLISKLARKSSTKIGSTWYRNDNIPTNSSTNPLGITSDVNKVYLTSDANLSTIATQTLEDITFNDNDSSVALAKALALVKSWQIQDIYLNRIADKVFEFKADSETLNCTFNISNVFNKVYSVDLEIPLIISSNKIALNNELSLTEIDELNGIAALAATTEANKFFVRYPNGMPNFYEDILNQKGFINRTRHTTFGIGDIGLVINRKINAPGLVTSGVVGIGITAPTGVKTDSSYVWPVQLGNGGFWELRGHTSLFWRSNDFCNPHFFAQVRYRIPAVVQRRIARIITHRQTRVRDEDGLKATALPLGSGFIYNPSSYTFTEPETTIPALAQQPLRAAEIHRGIMAQLRIGNLFNHVVFDNAFLDVYYLAEFEQEDSLGFRKINPEFDVPRALANTQKHAHTLGGTYIYQCSDCWQCEFTVKHVIFGKNTERTFHVGCGMRYNF